MKQYADAIENYERDGYVCMDCALSAERVKEICEETARLARERAPGTVFEKNDETVRALHGCHLFSDLMRDLTASPELFEFSKVALQSEIYVHQFKINFKAAFGGAVWPWHQDTIFWQKEDGLPRSDFVNAMIYLDEVTEFNGPLFFIPGSHQYGVMDGPENLMDVETVKDWKAGFSADLKYSLNQKTVERLVNEHGMVAPKGPAGTVVFFHGNIVHGSTPNISPFGRRILIVTYNDVSNFSGVRKNPRPEFVAARDNTPLQPLAV